MRQGIKMLLCLLLLISAGAYAQRKDSQAGTREHRPEIGTAVHRKSQPLIHNHTEWKDGQGNPIFAHDGGILRYGDRFYWYGSSYADNPSGKYGLRAGFAAWNGFQVYSSSDLVNWTYEGVALSRPEKGWGNLGTLGRAHALYNQKTEMFVMWYWYHLQYPAVFVMVAVSDTPRGPFTVLGPREVGSQTGFGSDLNVFQDDDGNAFLVYTDHKLYKERFGNGEDNYSILIDSLSDDYLHSNQEGLVVLQSLGTSRRDTMAEAPAMAKYKGKYIVAASGVDGWNPTETMYAVSSSPMGPYGPSKVMSEHKTWGAQITDLVYVKESDSLMAMCDQWWVNSDRHHLTHPAPGSTDLNKSRYLWIPVNFDPHTETAQMRFHRKWNPLGRGAENRFSAIE